MNCPSCGQENCACHQDKLAHPDTVVRSTYQPIHDGITKEEFGLNLYDVIKLIGGILGIDQQRATAIHKQQKSKQDDLLRRRQSLQYALAQKLPTLTHDELDQILDRYPWVVKV